MKQYKYICDGGTLMIGVEGFYCYYLNNVGDGEHNLFVFNNPYEFESVSECFRFVGNVRGKMNVYYSDVDHYDVLVRLDGLYLVYAKENSGDMALVGMGNNYDQN